MSYYCLFSGIPLQTFASAAYIKTDPLEFEILTAVVMKSSIFWDITTCGQLEVSRRFGGTYRFHLQGENLTRNFSHHRMCR
jgi:hypothetical protein